MEQWAASDRNSIENGIILKEFSDKTKERWNQVLEGLNPEYQAPLKTFQKIFIILNTYILKKRDLKIMI